MNGRIMIARMIEADRMPEPLGMPVVSVSSSEPGVAAAISGSCTYLANKRREDEQAPHAVDDRGDAGEQLHRRADRPAQRRGAKLGQEEGDAAGDRQGDDAAPGPR